MKRAVLIVDDEFFIRLDLVEMLESRGYMAFQASHAEEAISIMTEQRGITAVLSDRDAGHHERDRACQSDSRA